jgi:hypothetical protein
LQAEAADDGADHDDAPDSVPLRHLWRALLCGGQAGIRVRVPSRDLVCKGGVSSMAETCVKRTRREGHALYVRRDVEAGDIVAGFDGELISVPAAVRYRRQRSYPCWALVAGP